MLMLKVLVLVLSTTFSFSGRAAAAYKITGAPGMVDPKTGSPVPRQEINSFARSGPAFDLFVLALQEFQLLNQTDQFSYFQVAGIHGYPVVPWDGVVGSASFAGYCMHGSVLFPLWHRPYLALFEQLIWQHAQHIADTYPPGQITKYREAALTLRIPYWDWAINPALPMSYTTPTIFINTPSGWKEIKNPMYRYDFHPGPEGNGFPDVYLSSARYTTRCADPQLITSNDAQSSANMLGIAASTLSNTYQLLSSSEDYTHFSSASAGASVNIEAIHNSIHTNVGCDPNGSMFEPSFAAFDPIFWIHHAQVDRLTALWQALNPGTYVVPYINTWGSYYQPANSMDTINTPLAPFHMDDGLRIFTPEDVRSTTYFGYTYPELSGLNDIVHNAEQQATLRTKINQLYNSKITPTHNNRDNKANKRAISLAAAFNHVTLSLAQELGVNNLEIQWSIRIQMQLSATQSPIAIYFFMGAPPADAAKLSTSPNLIGTFAQFTAINLSTDPYSSKKTSITYGSVSLTHTLAAGMSRGYLSAITPSKVVPILKNHLHWSARTADNQEIPLNRVPGLYIAVCSRDVKPSNRSSEFPIYGKYKTHFEVTA